MSHPADVFRYCPRCGSAKFSSSGLRSFCCGCCNFSYYINSAAAVAALIFDTHGRLLLTRRAVEPDKGMLDLPGGFVDPGESAEDALRREIAEELGIKLKEVRYLASCPNEYPFSGLTVFTTDLAFLALPESLENMIPRDDISGFEWVDPQKVNPDDIPAASIRYFVTVTAVNEITGSGKNS
jgi:mutator protein MutT